MSTAKPTSTATPDQVFDLGKWDPLEDETFAVGKIRIDAAGMISLVSSEPEFEEPLKNILAAVNAQSEFRIKVPPSPSAEPGAVVSKTFTRSDPDFQSGLWEFLQQKHGLKQLPPPAAPEAPDLPPLKIDWDSLKPNSAPAD